MRAVSTLLVALVAMLAIASSPVGLAATPAQASSAASGASASTAGAAASSGNGSSGGTCNPYVNGTVIPVPCSAGGGIGGAGGGGGATGSGGSGNVSTACSFTPLDQAQAAQFGLPWPPPAGSTWALMDCVFGNLGPAPLVVLINASGTPSVTPRQLLDQALGELKLPYLDPMTAPPLRSDGLVGLPEWYWIPAASWHQLSVTVHAGPVWARATATPERLVLSPGGGLESVSCPGPGTAYDPAKSAAAQHTYCSYTYQQPSVGQPGSAYQASLTVTWRVSWAGSDGTGGILDAALPVSVDFPLRVGQGEALVSTP
jgi:hypothetical protein